jgi:hypothetical protein
MPTAMKIIIEARVSRSSSIVNRRNRLPVFDAPPEVQGALFERRARDNGNLITVHPRVRSPNRALNTIGNL